jgi:hypothetical protein
MKCQHEMFSCYVAALLPCGCAAGHTAAMNGIETYIEIVDGKDVEGMETAHKVVVLDNETTEGWLIPVSWN